MEVFNTVQWYVVATVSNYTMRFSVMKALQLVKGGDENIIFIMTKIKEKTFEKFEKDTEVNYYYCVVSYTLNALNPLK